MLLPGDQRELVLPLAAGVHETPPWNLFLHNLLARTQARTALMVVSLSADAVPTESSAIAPRARRDERPRMALIEDAGLRVTSLRPGRVYALDELFDHDDPAEKLRQRRVLERAGIRHGRLIRASTGDGADAWVILARYHEDLAAPATATLTGIAPHLTAGLRTLAALARSRMTAAVAESALQRLGIGQMALDAHGGLMWADEAASRLFTVTRGRLNLEPAATSALVQGCAAVAAEPPGTTHTVLLDEARGIWALLRKTDLASPPPAIVPTIIATFRLALGGATDAATAVLQRRHGLSRREALLAQAIAAGETIAEAAMRLGLTLETARNYSKRIYAKTGTKGQADLVREILGGLAPLA